MLEDVEKEIIDRVRQSKNILEMLASLEPEDGDGQSEIFKIQKGFLFVSLYSSIEYSLTSSVSGFLECLKGEPKKPLEYRKYILCAILNAEFNSVRDVSKKKVWKGRSAFFDSLFSDNNVEIDASVFPSEGINISYDQIKDIWKFFHLSGAELPEGVSYLLLNEVKDHRNAIAHGREKAAAVGARYTPLVLQEKERDVELICFHVLESFKKCLSENLYLVSGAA